MRIGTLLTAIDPCEDKFTKEHTLTIGKSYDVEFTTVYGFSIRNDAGNVHHFGHEDLETYFQSITPESLEELGFDKRKNFLGTEDEHWATNIGDIEIYIVLSESIEIYVGRGRDSNDIEFKNCRTLTDLKHLIRILGV